MANNFKVWAEDNDKLLSQEEFEGISKEGFKAGDLLSAQKINTILRQNSLMSTALANYLSKNNKNTEIIDYNSKEEDITAILENVLSSTKASAPIKITLNRDKWAKVSDAGAIWFQDIIISNFSPYDNVVIGNPVQQTIKLWDTAVIDTTIATEWNNVFQAVTFRKIVDETPYSGIRLYATKDLAVNLIIPIRTFSSNNDIISGVCLLTHEATNELFDDNGFCAHANSITEEMINASASAFGREDTICAQCGYLSADLLAPTIIAKTAECKHAGEKIYVPIKDYKHVTLCADCMQVINTVEHNWKWDTDEKGHWQICEDCGYIISKPIAHTWERNPDAVASSPYPDMYYKLEIGVDEDGNPIYSQDYHYIICDICGYKHQEGHAWNNQSGSCAKCGQKHTHEFENYSYSASRHYLSAECKICSYRNTSQSSTANHTINKRTIPYSVDKHKIEAYCENCDYIGEISSSNIQNYESQLSNHNIAILDLGNGYHKYYCTDCGWVQNIEAHHNLNENGECTICNGEVHTHIWEYSDNGDGTHSAVCQIDSSHIIASEAHELEDNKCTKCDYVYVTPDPPSHSHESTSGWVSDPTFHYKVCSICGEGYDFNLHDTQGPAKSYGSNYHYPHSCSVCGQGLDVEACDRNGGTESISATQHATYCSVCSNYFDATSHTFATSFDSEGHWQRCTACGYSTGVKTQHSLVWNASATEHWQKCSNCDYTTTKTPHTTQFIDKYDINFHWQECASCGYKKNQGAHVFGSWHLENNRHVRYCSGCNASQSHLPTDANNDTLCDVCGLPNYIN